MKRPPASGASFLLTIGNGRLRLPIDVGITDASNFSSTVQPVAIVRIAGSIRSTLLDAAPAWLTAGKHLSPVERFIGKFVGEGLKHDVFRRFNHRFSHIHLHRRNQKLSPSR